MPPNIVAMHKSKLRWFNKLSLPCSCVICDTPLFDRVSLCGHCKKRLPDLLKPCFRCATPIDSSLQESNLCGQCVINPPLFDSCNAVFTYDLPISRLISQFKYQANFSYGKVLTTLLIEKFIAHYSARIRTSDTLVFPDKLIPVPLHPRRLRQRGFNQAGEIARLLSRETGIPVQNNWVVRTKQTSAQSQLNASKRANNLKHAFELRDAAIKTQVQHIAIVDDVVTTMATVSSVTRMLKSAGVDRVDIWSIARAVLDT